MTIFSCVFTDFKRVGRLPWIIWMGPISSHEPLKAENFLQLQTERCCRMESQKESKCEVIADSEKEGLRGMD